MFRPFPSMFTQNGKCVCINFLLLKSGTGSRLKSTSWFAMSITRHRLINWIYSMDRLQYTAIYCNILQYTVCIKHLCMAHAPNQHKCKSTIFLFAVYSKRRLPESIHGIKLMDVSHNICTYMWASPADHVLITYTLTIGHQPLYYLIDCLIGHKFSLHHEFHCLKFPEKLLQKVDGSLILDNLLFRCVPYFTLLANDGWKHLKIHSFSQNTLSQNTLS